MHFLLFFLIFILQKAILKVILANVIVQSEAINV